MPRFETETTIKVYDNEKGGHIEIGPDKEGLGLIRITVGHGGTADLGTAEMTLEPEMAAVFAEAILGVAQDAIDKRTKENHGRRDAR